MIYISYDLFGFRVGHSPALFSCVIFDADHIMWQAFVAAFPLWAFAEVQRAICVPFIQIIYINDM
jgi:hypothetical protein